MRLPTSCRNGFTLVEVLVSTVLIVAIMVLLLGTVDQTQKLWARSRSKAVQFQSARAAFEVMSRRLSQATLNAYWRANDAEGKTLTRANFLFRRQAELQFLSGPTANILEGAPTVDHLNGSDGEIDENYPTHSMFFSVPLGATEYLAKEKPSDELLLKQFRSLDSTLVGAGYFVEFGPDPDVPQFVRDLQPKYPENLRYRLMEMTVPAEKFNIYDRRPLSGPYRDDKRLSDPRIYDEAEKFYDGFTIATNRKLREGFVRPYWMKEALRRIPVSGGEGAQHRFRYARVMAENVIALIVLPKLPVKDRIRIGTNPPVPDPDVLELAPEYGFDSWRVLTGKVETDPLIKPSLMVDNRTRDNLLPPTVQVTMVAIDAPSAQRMALTMDEKPKWTKGLFKTAVSERDVLNDIQQLETNIRDDDTYRNVNYRVFTTDVIIRGSKWSRDPQID